MEISQLFPQAQKCQTESSSYDKVGAALSLLAWEGCRVLSSACIWAASLECVKVHWVRGHAKTTPDKKNPNVLLSLEPNEAL